MSSTPDLRLTRLARSQFGCFTRGDAHRLGFSDKMLRTRVSHGWLERLSPAVFRLAGAPSTWEQQLLVAAWTGGDRCCVSHRAAAALHGFDGFTRERLDLVEVVHHQSRSYRGGHALAGVVIHTSSLLDARDRTNIGPIPVTSVVRTLIDLGSVVRIERLEEALDGAERDGKVQRDELVARHAQLRRSGRNGVGPLAVLLENRRAVADLPQSVLERRMLRALSGAGLPEPECQVRVPRADGRVAFLDLAYTEARIGIELDGHAWHATVRQRARDHERQNQIVLADWTVLRFTYEDVTQRPEYVATTVRNALIATGGRRARSA